ncbi:MAG: hypothetical protein QM813_22785 [Verrucomicrobiota bacterium]
MKMLAAITKSDRIICQTSSCGINMVSRRPLEYNQRNQPAAMSKPLSTPQTLPCNGLEIFTTRDDV